MIYSQLILIYQTTNDTLHESALFFCILVEFISTLLNQVTTILGVSL